MICNWCNWALFSILYTSDHFVLKVIWWIQVKLSVFQQQTVEFLKISKVKTHCACSHILFQMMLKNKCIVKRITYRKSNYAKYNACNYTLNYKHVWLILLNEFEVCDIRGKQINTIKYRVETRFLILIKKIKPCQYVISIKEH